MLCEVCQKETVIDNCHSMLVVLQKFTAGSSGFFQCDLGTEHNTLTYQHWHCSTACLLQGVTSCIQNHFTEGNLKFHPDVNFHRLVARAQLTCKVCQVPLSETLTGYRFCLTHATPVCFVPDSSLTDLGEWTCSIAHAAQSALDIVQRSITNIDTVAQAAQEALAMLEHLERTSQL